MNIWQEKADQAAALLGELKLDCWLTFVRESSTHPDPGVELVVGADVVRPSAFLFSVSGARTAIVANFDTAAVRARGVFTDVIGYDQDIRPHLLDVLHAWQPEQIGLNFSGDDVTADGLTHGMWLKLQVLLSGTPFLDRLTSADLLLRRLRGQKSASEIVRIRAAVEITEQIVAELETELRPGVSELQVADFIQQTFRRAQVTAAWPIDTCPIVNAGTESDFGHASPSATNVIQPGQLVHVDLGVRYEDYCSDLQRTWYILRADEKEAPAEIQHAAAAVADAIEAAAAALRPGAIGLDVDHAARETIVAAGYPEFMHAVGHGLGRAVHDGGTMLGPAWPCYGQMVRQRVEPGNVFTLELSVMTSAGCYGLEEDVLVTADGCEFISSYSRKLRTIAAQQ
ncbi:MAG: aminopeptidase P family protein [Planctomycetales bacterium]|nr:aminopeptidase P family protein [Planctomycetales bacterium]